MFNYKNNKIMNKNYSEELKLVEQFVDLFNEHYQDSLSKDSYGFELQMTDPKTKKVFFKCKIYGDCYDNLKNPDCYREVLANLSVAFVFAFKNNFKLA